MPVTKTIQYRYDATGNRSLMVDPDGRRFTYSYDTQNRISQIRNALNERTTFVYDANGRRTLKKLHGGQRTSYVYDDASNLTRIADIKSTGVTISSFDYRYDKVGNRTAVLEADGSRVTWSYDKTYQLTGEHRTGSNGYRHTFAYDPAGNRTLKNENGQRTSYTYDAANQLQRSEDASGLTTYTFDADGNQQKVQAPTGDRTTTVWDYENRTTLVQLPSGIRNTMAYDTGGLRVQLDESTDTKLFVWDDQRYLIEADGTGDTLAWYTVEPTAFGRIISKVENGQRRFFHYDGLGSTRVITAGNQNVTNRYTYDAWGNLVHSAGTFRNPFRFVGELGYYTDVETGTNYVRARIYQPSIGRWWSVDDFGHFTLYAYSMNAPLTYHDPSGLFSTETNITERTQVPSRGQCPQFPPGVYLRAKSSFTDYADEVRTIKRLTGSRSVKFLQQVTIAVNLSIGESDTYTCAAGQICDCKTYSLDYNLSFLEIISLKEMDQHSAQADILYLTMLKAACGNIIPNWCCPWSYSYTVTKTITLGATNKGPSSFNRVATADYNCNGRDVHDANPSLPKIVPNPGKGTLVFPDPPVADVFASTLELTMMRPRCGAIQSSLTPPGYERQPADGQ